jgi:hypothetical protein
MANVTGVVQEFLEHKGKEFIADLYAAPQVKDLVTNYPEVDGTIILPTANIAKDLIKGYDGDDTAEDDAVLMQGVNLSTSMHKLVLEVDLGDGTMRAYRNWLRANGKSADEVSVIEYFVTDAQIREKIGSEIDIAAFQGVATNLPGAGESLKTTVAGFRRLLKTGAGLTTPTVKAVTTGDITAANAVGKLETMYTAVDEAMQMMGIAIIVSFKTYNNFRINYHNTFSNSAVEEMIQGTTYKGANFHLGAGKSFVIPFVGMGNDDSVIMTPLSNLAYLYDLDSAFETLDIQKIGFKHKILGRMPIGFGVRKMTQKYCYVNDKLVTLS